ncbi:MULTISPECIES: potassium-transporting ATPase subunit KdpC [Sphingomonas]|uniref:potassium-transporting ATPase subunit KdpC n=1 Tax=Sphingomonas TaxID=13687 RepID=UPI000DF00D6B|nr:MULTISPECIES: potassium-transporting ATPase subunit KdpC [Sphingomonas]
MGTDLKTALRPAFVLLLLLTILTGLVYPLTVTGVAQLALPAQANGSLVRDGDRIVGSALIGQDFAAPRYFHPRPSAAGAGYDASASSGSNLGPTSKALADNIRGRIQEARAAGITGPIPADLVTASGSGLDPDISPANAMAQAPRVAAARGMPVEAVRALIAAATVPGTLGLLGEPHLNVLALNRQLDSRGAQPGQ